VGKKGRKGLKGSTAILRPSLMACKLWGDPDYLGDLSHSAPQSPPISPSSALRKGEHGGKTTLYKCGRQDEVEWRGKRETRGISAAHGLLS